LNTERRTLDPDQIHRDTAALAPLVRDVSKRIHEHPELRFEERRAAAWLAEAIESEGVAVERGVGGLETAFRARVGDGCGPRVALLAEYDALPEIGHACGHNLIAAGALGAFLALARQASAIKGAVEIIGTPAEEGGGGKIRLLDAGVFEGIDAAMMFHPLDRDMVAPRSLASRWLRVEFSGKASHAAMAPWDGRSALTAVLQTFQLIDSQRVHLRDGVRVHGIIVDGGRAVNIIPERAVAEFSVRANDAEELAGVAAVVERCAAGAAIACGIEVKIEARGGYKDFRGSSPLERRFGEHLAALGRADVLQEGVITGSTDMGDVSYVVPSIHAMIGICDPGAAACHQRPFADHAGSDRGFESALIAARTLALTAKDVLEDAALREAMTRAFAEGRGRR
jgi:amidohydrolase